MDLRQLPRLARTLRPLRPSQLVWRGRYALERRLPAPHIRLPVAYDEQELRHVVRSEPLPDALRAEINLNRVEETVRDLDQGVFRHLHLALPLGRTATNWRLGAQTDHRLWTITLHYHEWLYRLAVAARLGCDLGHSAEGLITRYLFDWITRCDLQQPGARDLAWNSYAISTRIGWWIRSYRLLGRDWWNIRSDFHGQFLGSLWRQAEFLYGHPEWDLRGNHILRNAVGLAWGARFFSGPRADDWMKAAEAIAGDQIEEQILTDGGHFERSPMYHAHVMEDVRALSHLVRNESLRRDLHDAHESMSEFLEWMRHPDGCVAQFNDGEAVRIGVRATDYGLQQRGIASEDPASDTGVVSAPEACRQKPVAHSQPVARHVRGARYFAASGFCAWHGSPWSLFVDVGEVGPDCQPGHAHADTLSLECSYRGERLFVDPGTHSYDHNAARRYDRSTSSHNTVCVDGRDSSEVWHIFRVGARARPVDVRVEYTPRRMLVEAAHTGYDQLPGSPRHSRRVEVFEADDLRITDRVTGSESHQVSGGWLLAPGWRAATTSGGWELTNNDRRVCVELRSSSPIGTSIEPVPHHPEYGLEIMTHRLVWRYEGTLPLEVTTVVTPR